MRFFSTRKLYANINLLRQAFHWCGNPVPIKDIDRSTHSCTFSSTLIEVAALSRRNKQNNKKPSQQAVFFTDIVAAKCRSSVILDSLAFGTLRKSVNEKHREQKTGTLHAERSPNCLNTRDRFTRKIFSPVCHLGLAPPYF